MVFFSSPVGQYAVQVLVHSVLLALVVETLLKIWQVGSPATRVQFRLLYLLVPLFGWPLYQLLWPGRGSDGFRESLALIDTQQWLPLQLAGIPGWGWVAVVMGLGMLLFASRALVPTGHHHLRGGDGVEVTLAPALADKLENGLRRLSGIPGPGVRVVDEPWAGASLSGVRRPRLTVSARLVELLDEEELEGALAHEAAHAVQRDNPRGWSLLLLWLLMFYNPVALAGLQRISRDVEMACDDAAVTRTGRPLALASALIKAARFNAGRSMGSARPAPVGWLSRLDSQVGNSLVARRARRLADYRTPEAVPLKWLRLALTAFLSAALLFFVV